ncbi:MAG: glutathione S-transferase family protein [Prochlorothrix sp.]
MLELYQFDLSHYCEKVRLVLDYKGLPYHKVEVTPGWGQFDLYRLSGQRQVPVLKTGSTIIADSTAIVEYLEHEYPAHPVIPTDSPHQGYCLALEEWADASIGLNARTALVGSLGQNPTFPTALLPAETPEFFRSAASTVVQSVPTELWGWLGAGVGFGPAEVAAAHRDLRQNLKALCLILKEQPFLVGQTPTLADFAVAGLSFYVKFPDFPGVGIPEALRGQGIP